MKTKEIKKYHINGKLWCRYHLTEDYKKHGLDEWYYDDGNIDCLCYWNMDKLVKLENDYYGDVIEINYYI